MKYNSCYYYYYLLFCDWKLILKKTTFLHVKVNVGNLYPQQQNKVGNLYNL